MAFKRKLPYDDLPLLPSADTLESKEILRQLAMASRCLGELNGRCSVLSDQVLMINAIALHESKDSSAIENIITTPIEVYLAINDPSIATPAAKEVLRYRNALFTGLNIIASGENKLSVDVMVEIV